MKVITTDKEDLFDNTPGYDDETGVKFAPGLSKEERRQATLLYRIFNELWGVLIVKGAPGAGKDLFGNFLSFTLKRFFPHKRILRDEKPRELYGEYDGLFNEKVLAEDLDKMKLVAKGKGILNINQAMEDAATDWVTTKGEVMLKNSVLYLTEYWKYCYKREPHKPMNKTMGAIHKVKRHLDVLIIGTVQMTEDLDKYTCLPFVDWEAVCTRNKTHPSRYTFYIYKVKWVANREMLVPTSKSYSITFDAAKPISYLGDGKIKVLKNKYSPETEEERVVLEALKSGINEYDSLVEILEEYSEVTEEETLDTLIDLKFNKRKRAIDYPNWYGIYNSKSAQQIDTSLKISG